MKKKLKQIWDNPPDFINEKGVKWWLDKDTTRYAHKEDLKGIKLINIFVWLIEEPNKRKTRVLTNDNTKEIIYESQSLEAIGAKIDWLKLNEKFLNNR